MMKLLFALFVFALGSIGPAQAACPGADPAIVAAGVRSTTSDGSVNRYTIAIRVANVGRAKQPSNLLQSVDIYENGIKLDTKGLPPLAPGKGYTFTYVYQRSTDAGAGTSVLRMHLIVHQPSPPEKQDCNFGNDILTLTF
jgi:hypothetical protein